MHRSFISKYPSGHKFSNLKFHIEARNTGTEAHEGTQSGAGEGNVAGEGAAVEEVDLDGDGSDLIWDVSSIASAEMVVISEDSTDDEALTASTRFRSEGLHPHPTVSIF